MGIKILTISVFFLFGASMFAMQPIEKDTSYTVGSSYLKYKKDFPQIAIARAKEFTNVETSLDIIYKTTSVRNLHLDAYINSDNIVNPAVILIHGGGWKSGSKSHMKPLAQYIAAQGYSCFTVEYRLSDEAKYPEGIYDIKEVIQYIKMNAAKFNVDSSKVAILGCSSGAQMATLVGTTNNNPKFEKESRYNTSTTVHAIVNLDGIVAFIHPKSKESEMAAWWLGGTVEEKFELWQEASALTHADQYTPPTLFISSQYERFQAGREEMIEILNKHAIYSQVEIVPNSPHTFWLFHPWFDETVNYIITFLDKTFK